MNNKGIGLLVGIIVVLGGGYYVMNSGTKEVATPTPAQPVTPPVATAPTYKDGTYTAAGQYSAPSGKKEGEMITEEIGVSLTLKGGVIVDSTVTPKGESQGTVYNQKQFIENYKPLVTGKSIDEVKLSNVSGSSLTPEGFNAAVELIKAEAKA